MKKVLDYDTGTICGKRTQSLINIVKNHFQNKFNIPILCTIGIIPGVVQSSPQALDPNEIFELGRHAYNLNDWTHSRDWMRTALAEIRGDSSVSADQTATVLDYLAYSEFKVGFNDALY